jgi:SpoVK/Ycf46/Vps4 family AAA+-type ATPase
MNGGPLYLYTDDLVQLSRLALTGQYQDVRTYVRRLAKRLKALDPESATKLEELLQSSPMREVGLRSVESAVVPRDADSRLKLIREEFPVVLDVEPIWGDGVRQSLRQAIEERNMEALLSREGLMPTRSLLFTGRPGVGKTLAAKWLAREIGKPLMTLDLSAVMSSFLGKTGANVRHVLDYAKSTDCILFLDELDAIAKRRDDLTEIGELKRLVTVLLQEIDDWPATGLLLAATNHPDLLDPAIWRRFDAVVEFPMPSEGQVQQMVRDTLAHRVPNKDLLEVLSFVLQGRSFSEVSRELHRLVRLALVSSIPLEDSLREFIRSHTSALDVKSRKLIASCLMNAGFNQRETHEWTGVHRDTIRRMSSEESL